MNTDQPTLIIRDMRLEDISRVAEIHRKCFSDHVSLFSALHPVVARHLYARYVEELESMGKVLVDPKTGTVTGFAAGTLKPGFHMRFLRTHFLMLLRYILLGLVTRPVVWKMLARALFIKDPFRTYRKNPLRFEKAPPAGPVGYFMPIAIDPDCRGGGNAVRLAHALMDHFFTLGAARIRGNKIDIQNIPSRKLFVEKLGWDCAVIENHCYIVWKDKEKGLSCQSGKEDPVPQSGRWIARPMKVSDLSEITRLYIRCFPQRENTVLGSSFIERFCLQALLEKQSVVVVIEDSSSHRLVAAAAGTLQPGFGLRFIKRNKFFFIGRVFLGFLKSSLIRKKVFHRMFFFLKKKTNTRFSKIDCQTGQKIPPGTRLNHLFVCVDPDWQQKGLGKRILSCFMETMFQMGAKRLWGCVETSNIASLKLHSALGWKSQQTSEDWFTVWADTSDRMGSNKVI